MSVNDPRQVLINLAKNNIELINDDSSPVTLDNLQDELFDIGRVRIKGLPDWIKNHEGHYSFIGGRKTGYAVIHAHYTDSVISRRISGYTFETFLQDYDNCEDADDRQDVLHKYFNRI
jgi:hypothetical protein